jgi:hypothetical protein
MPVAIRVKSPDDFEGGLGACRATTTSARVRPLSAANRFICGPRRHPKRCVARLVLTRARDVLCHGWERLQSASLPSLSAMRASGSKGREAVTCPPYLEFTAPGQLRTPDCIFRSGRTPQTTQTKMNDRSGRSDGRPPQSAFRSWPTFAPRNGVLDVTTWLAMMQIEISYPWEPLVRGAGGRSKRRLCAVDFVAHSVR